MITVQVKLNLTPQQLDKLASARAAQVGRANPRKPWTDKERKEYAREWIEREVMLFLEQPKE